MVLIDPKNIESLKESLWSFQSKATKQVLLQIMIFFLPLKLLAKVFSILEEVVDALT